MSTTADQDRDRSYRPPLSVTRPQLLTNKRDDRFREVIYALFVTATRFQEVRDAFGRDIGLTGPQYFIVIATAHYQQAGGVGVKALAQYLHVAASHVTVETHKLIDKGLLIKRPNPADARGVLLTLTDQGMAALEKLAPFRQNINNILFDGVTRDEFTLLARLLERFIGSTARAKLEISIREHQREHDEVSGSDRYVENRQ